jgi:hypothetical protein
MASKTLSAHGFPAGTSVSAYPRRALVNGGPPTGAALDTSTVAGDESLTFDGLTEGEGYVAWGAGRPVSFFVEEGGLRSDLADRERIEELERTLDSVAGSIGRLPLNVKDPIGVFVGATGDGTTDDSDAFIRARETGRPMYVPSGTYRITETPFLGDEPLNIFGDGPGRTIIDLEGVNFATLSGVLGSSVSVTASMDKGDTTVTLDVAGLAVGDDLIVRDDDQVLQGTVAAPYAGVVGEVVRIKTVGASTVTIWGGIEQQMTLAAGNLNARKITPIDGVGVSAMTIRNPNPATYTGGNARALTLAYCRNVRVGSVDFVQLDDDGVHLDSCVDWEVVDCKFNDLQNVGGRTPYGVLANNASVNGLVHGCRQNGGRHMFTTGGDDGEIGPAHILVSDCQAWHSTAAPFDTHPAGRHVTFDTCTSHGCTTGFVARSPYTQILNPQVVGMGVTGVGVQLSGPATGSSVAGGDIRNVSAGVQIDAEDCRVFGWPRISAADRAVRVPGTVDITGTPNLTKVDIREVRVDGNPSVAGVQFQGSATTTRIVDHQTIIAPDATTKVSPATPSAASTAALTLPIAGEFVDITGTAAITSITANRVGKITLRFLGTAGTTGLTDGSNLKLAGNLVYTADDTCTLWCDGTNWTEMARSVN